jgi:hypothetical protein
LQGIFVFGRSSRFTCRTSTGKGFDNVAENPKLQIVNADYPRKIRVICSCGLRHEIFEDDENEGELAMISRQGKASPVQESKPNPSTEEKVEDNVKTKKKGFFIGSI